MKTMNYKGFTLRNIGISWYVNGWQAGPSLKSAKALVNYCLKPGADPWVKRACGAL